MKLEVKGQIFPEVWGIAKSIKKFRVERVLVNLGSGTVEIPVYEVTLPAGTKKQGTYLVTPRRIKIYHKPIDQYEIGYLISELDEDPLKDRFFTI